MPQCVSACMYMSECVCRVCACVCVCVCAHVCVCMPQKRKKHIRILAQIETHRHCVVLMSSSVWVIKAVTLSIMRRMSDRRSVRQTGRSHRFSGPITASISPNQIDCFFFFPDCRLFSVLIHIHASIMFI